MKDRTTKILLGIIFLILLFVVGFAIFQPKPAALTPTPAPTPTPTPASLLVEGTDGNPWWNDTVFYEVFVRSFYDSNGDGKGDLQGLIQKLDYLNDGDPDTHDDLGVTGIWLMPINPSPSYHGYDVTDYYDVNPDYGTLDDMKQLLEEAHKRDIRVIMDLVLNHTSAKHPWFIDAKDVNSPYHDWYIWSKEDPGYLGPWNEKVWIKASNGLYYYAMFWDQMPDLNYRTEAVTDEMEKVVSFWLKDVGVDGFRLDAARHLIEDGTNQANTPETHAWFKDFRPFYKGINPQAITVGEVADTSFSAVSYIKGDELDLVFNFDLGNSIMTAVNGGDAAKLSNALSFENGLFENAQMATFLTNHDQNRVMSVFGNDVEKGKAAATVLLTMPGVPFIYYGEEIGLTGSKPDENIRTPMQWSAEKFAGFSTEHAWASPKPGYEKKNVAVQLADAESLLRHYIKLIQLRNEHEALRIGTLYKVATGSTSVYAGLRVSDEEVFLIIINLSDKPIDDLKLDLSDRVLKGTYSVEDLLNGGQYADLSAAENGSFSDYQPVTQLPANANLVLKLTSNNK